MTSKLRWAPAGLAVVLALAAGAVAASPPPGKALGDFFFGPKLARGELVLVINGVVHDFRVDRGRVKSVARGAIELRELDGTIQIVPVAPDALVEGQGGRQLPLGLIRRGMIVVTIRDGDGPAERVIVVLPHRPPR